MMAHAWAIQVMCLPHVLSPGQLSITVGHSGQIKRFLLSLSAKEPNYNSVPGTATAATAAHHDWSLPHNVGWMKSVGGLSIVTVRRLWHKRTRLSFLAGVTALWKAPLCWLFLPACRRAPVWTGQQSQDLTNRPNSNLKFDLCKLVF